MCPWLFSRTLQASLLPASRQDFDVNGCRALAPGAEVQILAPVSFYKRSGTGRQSHGTDCNPGNTINVQLIIWHYRKGLCLRPAGLFLRRLSRLLHSFVILCFVWKWLFHSATSAAAAHMQAQAALRSGGPLQ